MKNFAQFLMKILLIKNSEKKLNTLQKLVYRIEKKNHTQIIF